MLVKYYIGSLILCSSIMSLNQLTLDQRKPWLDVRVEDLRAENVSVDTQLTAQNVTVNGTLIASISPSLLPNSGVTAGTYTDATVTVNSKGLVTAASSGTSSNTRYLYNGGMSPETNPSSTILLTATSPYGAFIIPANTFNSSTGFILTLRGKYTASISNTLNLGYAIGPVGSPVSIPLIDNASTSNTGALLLGAGFEFIVQSLTGSQTTLLYSCAPSTTTTSVTSRNTHTYSGPTNIPLQIIPAVSVTSPDAGATLTQMVCTLQLVTPL